MNTCPLVSILTASYNNRDYLDEYFNSLLEQTYQNIELVLIDDASNDNSWEKILAYQHKLENRFSNVVLLRNQNNLGAFQTRIHLNQIPNGKFISVLDSDDYYKPEMLSTCIDYLIDNPAFGAVHSDVDFQYPDYLEKNHWASLGRSIPEGDIYERLLVDNIILTCTFLCRADLFKKYVDYEKYAARGYLAGDYPMFLDLARRTNFGFIDHSLAVYRVVPDSISHPQDIKKQFSWKEAYYRIKIDYIKEYGASPDIKARANRQYFRTLMESGYATFDKKKFERGYRWLVSRYPEEFLSLVHRLHKFSMHSQIIWFYLNRLENRMRFTLSKNVLAP